MYWAKTEPLHLSVEMKLSNVALKIRIFQLSSWGGSLVMVMPFCSKTLELMFLILSTRVFFPLAYLEQWVVVWILYREMQIWLRQCWKLCLNFCSWRWLRPRHNLIISLNLLVLSVLGSINFKMLFFKKINVSEFLIFWFS